MQTDGQAQVSLTDPDARSMKNRDGGIVGYNVQAAVDAEHHLIVAHEVVTEASTATSSHRWPSRPVRPPASML